MNLMQIKDRENQIHIINPIHITRIYFNPVPFNNGTTVVELSSGEKLYTRSTIKEIADILYLMIRDKDGR